MKKKLPVAALILCVAVLSVAVGAYAAPKFSLLFDGKKTSLDAQVIKGDAYVSAKKLGELLGYKVAVDTKKSSISVSLPTPKLKPGEYLAKQFIFSDVQVEQTDFGWTIDAEARVLKSVKAASFTLTFFDGSGKRVGTAIGSLSNVAIGDTVTVKFVTADDLTGWAKLRPQVDISF